MAVIYSFLELQAMMTDNETAKHLLRESRQRIRTMALIHAKLYKRGDFIAIGVKEYITELVYEIISSNKKFEGNISVRSDIAQIQLNLDTMIPVGLIINELVTNSVKYAFINNAEPELNIELREDGPDCIVLKVSDNGPGIHANTDNPVKTTLGIMIVEGLIGQLEGSYTVNCDNGTSYDIRFPRR